MVNVNYKNEDDILIAELNGEINILEVNDLKENIKEKIIETQAKEIIIDLENVPFMDSSGLGMLISLFKFANEKKGKIVYTGLSAYLIKILGFAKLDKIFTIEDSVNDAVGSFK